MQAPTGGPSPPRGRGNPGAAIVLVVWTSLLVLASLGGNDSVANTWTAFALLACLCGLLVALGRSRARRDDTWNSLLAIPVSLLGPVGIVFLFLPPVRRALREVSPQLRASGDALLQLGEPEREPVATPASAPVPAGRPLYGQRFVFGDLRRPRKLALVLVASVALFPVLWSVFLVLYGLGGSTGGSTQHAERVIVVLAAIPAATGVVVAFVDWFRARRRSEEAPGFSGREAILSGCAALLAMTGAVALGVWAWNTEL